MTEITITPASAADVQALADLFVGHISAHPEYISHGEIQMGVGEGTVQDDRFIVCPAPDALVRYLFIEFEDYKNDKIQAGRIASMKVEFVEAQ